MIVHALLHNASAKLFSAALSNAGLVTSTTALEFSAALAAEHVDVAVVDPSVDAGTAGARAGCHPVVRALSAASAPPFILYLSGERADIPLRAALLRLGPAMLAARGIDDHAERLCAIVNQAIVSPIPEEVLTRLEPRLAPLGPHVRDAIANALQSPMDFDSVRALADGAGVKERTLTRHLEQAGLAQARMWLAAGRVLHAHWEMRNPVLRVRELVALMGYSDEEPLARDVATIAGGTPGKLRNVSAEQLIIRVIEHLTCRHRERHTDRCLEREVPRPVYQSEAAEDAA